MSTTSEVIEAQRVDIESSLYGYGADNSQVETWKIFTSSVASAYSASDLPKKGTVCVERPELICISVDIKRVNFRNEPTALCEARVTYGPPGYLPPSEKQEGETEEEINFSGEMQLTFRSKKVPDGAFDEEEFEWTGEEGAVEQHRPHAVYRPKMETHFIRYSNTLGRDIILSRLGHVNDRELWGDGIGHWLLNACTARRRGRRLEGGEVVLGLWEIDFAFIYDPKCHFVDERVGDALILWQVYDKANLNDLVD